MARMPSSRALPLSPRAVPPPGSPTPAEAHLTDPLTEVDGDQARAPSARAGGFHESSYELTSALEVIETEWPDDSTVPGALGDR